MTNREDALREAARLERIGASYAAAVREGRWAGLVARPGLMERVAGALRQGENTLLVGRPGSGRTSLVRLAAAIVLGREVPNSTEAASELAAAFARLLDQCPGAGASAGPELRDLLEVNVSAFQVEAIWVNEFETKVAAIVAAAKAERVALFIPDFHLARQAGAGYQSRERTLANLLLPSLRSGDLRLVASTTPLGLQALRFAAPEVLRFFTLLEVPDADEAEAQRLLAAASGHLPHGARISTRTARRAVEISRRSHAGYALPGRAFDLARETAARLRAEEGSAFSLSESALLDTYRTRTGLRAELVHRDHALGRPDVESHLSSRVFGQQEAVEAAARLVLAFKTQLVPTGKPIATLMLAGPTGVGKTHLAQCLAEYLFGSTGRLVRFDMGEYADADAPRRLVGGHAEDGEAGLLAQLRGTPFAVLLLDEIEKAHPRALGVLLSLLDEGVLTDFRGDSVSCENIVVILTTNVGSEAYRRSPIALAPGQATGAEAVVRKALENHFAPEFLNRMTDVIVFQPLEQEALRAVARAELDALARLAFDRGIGVVAEGEVAERLAALAAASPYGAREIQRAVRRLVRDPVAEQAALGARYFRVVVEQGEVAVRAAGLRVVPGPRPSPAHLFRDRVTDLGPARPGHPQEAKDATAKLLSLRGRLREEPGKEELVLEAARSLVAVARFAYQAGRADLAGRLLRDAQSCLSRLSPAGNVAADEVSARGQARGAGMRELQ